MYTITKEFQFSASHQLIGLKENHPCMQLHGHNYIVIVECRNTALNKNGFIIDYNDLSPIKKYLDDVCDHRHLNDTLPLDQPSAENMAKLFFETFHNLLGLWQVTAVSVCETSKTIARYEPNNR